LDSLGVSGKFRADLREDGGVRKGNVSELVDLGGSVVVAGEVEWEMNELKVSSVILASLIQILIQVVIRSIRLTCNKELARVSGVFVELVVLSEPWTLVSVSSLEFLSLSFVIGGVNGGEISSLVSLHDVLSLGNSQLGLGSLGASVDGSDDGVTIIRGQEWKTFTTHIQEASGSSHSLQVEESGVIRHARHDTVHVLVYSASLEHYWELFFFINNWGNGGDHAWSPADPRTVVGREEIEISLVEDLLRTIEGISPIKLEKQGGVICWHLEIRG
jgi:hypothetical protein